jgi:hypothetical protein
MEGPQFSTKAESRLYRQWGVDVIGMTNMPEAKLAREAELCYATMALATDYDCWHETQEAVTVDAILATLNNVAQTRFLGSGAVCGMSGLSRHRAWTCDRDRSNEYLSGRPEEVRDSHAACHRGKERSTVNQWGSYLWWDRLRSIR